MGDRSTVLLPRVGYGALVAAAFLVPIASAPMLADSFSLPKAVVLWVASALAVLGAVVQVASCGLGPVRRLRILPPLALLVGWTAIATAASPQPLVSLLGSYGRYDGLITLVAGGAVALALVVFTAAAPGRLAAVAVALLASALVGLVVVVLQALGVAWDDWAVPGLGSLEVVGLGGNPNFSGALLALAVPFALGLGLGRHLPSRRARAAMVVLAAALAAGTVTTQTRGGILALIAGVAAFAWLAPDLLPRAVRYAASAILVATLAVVAVTSLTDSFPLPTPAGTDAVLDTTSLDQRQSIWAGAARVAVQHPVVGAGPDTLALALPYERSSRPDGRALVDADEAHNIYLDRTSTAGLPALAAYLWLVGAVAVSAWRGRRRVADEHRWLLAAFGGALAGYLLQGVFSIDAVPLAFVAWVCVGALSSLTDPAALAAGSQPPAEARPVPTPVLAALVALTAVAVVVAFRPVAADRQAQTGMVAADEGRYLDAYGAFASASSWMGHEPTYRQRAAAALVGLAAEPSSDPELRRSFLDEALLAYDQVLDRAPGDVPTRLAQADTHLLAAEAASSTDDASAHVAASLAILRGLEAELRADDELDARIGRALEVRAQLGTGTDAQRDRAAAAERYEVARGYRLSSVPALVGLARLALEDDRTSEAGRYLDEARRLAPDDPELEAAADEVDRRIRGGG
jgi:O-antigen ligase